MSAGRRSGTLAGNRFHWGQTVAKKNAKPIRGDDEDDDDRPRKFKKKTKDGPPMGLILGGVGLAVVLVGAAGAAAYFLRPKPKPTVPTPDVVSTTPDKPAPTAPDKPAFAWKPFTLTGLGAGYRAVFPNDPPAKIDPFEAVKDDNAVGLIQATGLKMDKWEGSADGLTYSVTAFRPPDASALLGGADALKELGLGGGAPPDPLEAAAKNPGLMILLLGGGRRLDETDAVLNGVKYKQVTMRANAKQAVVRIYGLKEVAIALRVEGPGVTADNERVKYFFLNLTPAR